MNKHVAIVGISANPVHYGHLALLDAAADTGYFNEVWLMPCYGHKFGKELAIPEHRLKMCELAIEGKGDRYKVSDFEIKIKSNGVAYDTVRALQMTHPGVKFHWVIGMDNANVIEKWAFSEELRKLIPFWVFPRKGVEPDPKVTWYKEGHHTYVNYIHLPACAATDVRKLIADKDLTSACQLLPMKVYHYINLHNLYAREETHETANPV